MTLNSDHLPIIIDLDGWFASPPKETGPSCYTNYRKANWTLFTSETEQHFSRLEPPTSAEAGEKILRKILQKATDRNIPRGKISDYTPGLSQHCRELVRQRDALRSQNPTNPLIAEKDEQIQRENN